MQLAPSLHRIGSDIVSCHLVVDDRGVTLVDAGLPGHWRELIAELAAIGRSVDDIRGVVLTHGDTDHLGIAERLRREHDVVIYIHEEDAKQARGESKKKNPSWGRIALRPLVGFLWYAGRRGGMRATPVAEVTTVHDGETLELPGDPHIIHIPGHSPGSIAIHVPTIGALFVGDAMTTRHVLTGAKGPQPAPFTLDPDRALASLTRLEGLETSWVLPGHGPPWPGSIDEAIRQVREAAASGPRR